MKGKRILVIDDASLIRLYYRDALTRAGYEVDEALNGLEALELLLTTPADLLIVDINMPKMDGVSFLKALRRQSLPLGATPALVTSTEAAPQDQDTARAAGANFYLVKSVPQDVLVRYVDMLCGSSLVNEFLEQFLIESRELVEQATSDLLALEVTPADHERLDSAFRAFHTLKGAAGIVDFLAMGRLLHAAENVLSAVRAGDNVVTTDLISDGLSALDQVVQWLDVIETAGDLPAVPDDAADGLIARFERSTASEVARAPSAKPSMDWVEALLAAHPAQWSRASAAIRYTPDRDCFFRGEDPLGLIAQLPDLLAVRVTTGPSLISLETVDPFACDLVIEALTGGSAEAAAEVLRTVSDQVRLMPLTIAAETSGDKAFSDEVRAVLESQIALLGLAEPDGRAGRTGSAIRSAANVLRYAGRPDDAQAVERAGEQDRDVVAILQTILSPPSSDAADLTAETGGAPDIAARGLRVAVERIDDLVKLTDELTVVKNALGHATRLAQDGADPATLALTLRAQHALLERLISELQRSVLGIRVLPLRNLFQRFPRVVREIAANLGKSARLVTEGDATEADKAVVEALFEPLLHVIRNALDHGVEPADDRRAAGKPETATIHLRAERDGEHVIVEVSDDGRGVDVARVREVAQARGAATPDALAAMTDEDLIDLIFAPGFSTARTVSDVSGRGVGMDAVRSAISRLGGQTSITSRPGEGASVRFALPFTLMMTRVMTVEAAGQVLGVPFEAVMETLRLPRERIASVGAAKAVVLRDKTIPLIQLAEALELTRAEAVPSKEANILVVAVGSQLAALEVDRFGERLDVMLKPMEGLLARMAGVAGATLMGDGRVLIVLDMKGLLQ